MASSDSLAADSSTDTIERKGAESAVGDSGDNSTRTRIGEDISAENQKKQNIRVGVLMSIAYACNIGGTGSLIGSTLINLPFAKKRFLN